MPGGSFLAGKAQTTHFSFFFSFLHSPSLHFRHTDTDGDDFFFMLSGILLSFSSPFFFLLLLLTLFG